MRGIQDGPVPKNDERRTAKRRAVRWHVTATPARGKTLGCTAMNAAIGGILLESHERLRVGLRVALNVYVGMHRFFCCSGEVIREERGNGRVWRYGIRFADLAPTDRSILLGAIQDDAPQPRAGAVLLSECPAGDNASYPRSLDAWAIA